MAPPQPASAPRPQPCAHGVGRVTWSGAGMREPHHPHPSRDGSQIGGPVPPPSRDLTPPSAGLSDFDGKGASQPTTLEVEVEFYYGVFCSGVLHLTLSTFSQPARQVARTPPRTCPPSSSRLWPCPCSPCPCKHGADLTIGACLRVQGASSTCLMSILNVPLHTFQLEVRPAAETISLAPAAARAAHCACPLQGRARRPFDPRPSSRAFLASGERDAHGPLCLFF